MNFEGMVKEGKKFTYREFNVDIIDTNLFTGTAYVMLGRCSDDSDLYWFFDKKTGHGVDVNGIRANLSIDAVLTVVKEEKEGWFAIIYYSPSKMPLMFGIFDTKEKCEERCKDCYGETRYEIHRIIYVG